MTYDILEEAVSTDDTYRISYGIIVYSESEADGTVTILKSVHDITEDRRAVAELVSLCNRLALSPLHLLDVVDDFLNR